MNDSVVLDVTPCVAMVEYSLEDASLTKLCSLHVYSATKTPGHAYSVLLKSIPHAPYHLRLYDI